MNSGGDGCGEVLGALGGLSVFSKIRERPVVCAFENLIGEAAKKESDPLKLIGLWAAWIQLFAADIANDANDVDASFLTHWANLALNDENIFSLSAERGEFCESSLLATLAKNDLERIISIAAFDIQGFTKYISEILKNACLVDAANFILKDGGRLACARDCSGIRPQSGRIGAESPVAAERRCARSSYLNLNTLAAFFREHGAGDFSRYSFFHWKCGGGFLPALNGDDVTMEMLSGYEGQREIVVANTLRFLDGAAGANNILLYGDRGTGKSATVKAVCNSYAWRGLRLVAIGKKDLHDLPLALSTLASRGLFFVLFIDDLSFESQDDSFNTLKALLEGGIEARPKNVVIYATSNRRHLVKEKSQDRPDSAAAAASFESGDMRAFDTMQEQFSLADRFGITVVFTSPSRDEYLAIAEFLAKLRGILSDNAVANELEIFRANALKWERWFNGRSPRTASQYIDWLSGGAGFPWE
jgi:predicted AAA+ superfamily ATPase